MALKKKNKTAAKKLSVKATKKKAVKKAAKKTKQKVRVTKTAKSVKTAKPKVQKIKKVLTIPVELKEERKTSKPGRKSKKEKEVIAVPAPVYFEADKNSPKEKVKTILISQPKPDSDKSPYFDLARKHNLKLDFRSFTQIEPVLSKEFRLQKVNLHEHNAVILTSRIAIDHYFRMCNEMRYVVPETTKYFCLTESIAYYLQKYVQYRKRKIFFGHQSISDLVDVIKKHKEERFLLPVSDIHKEQIADLLDNLGVQYSKAIFYRTVSADLSDLNIHTDYNIIVFFTPAAITSLFKNFPKFKQGNIRIAGFGPTTCKSIKEHKLRLDIAAPSPVTPSMTMALDNYIREANKR